MSPVHTNVEGKKKKKKGEATPTLTKKTNKKHTTTTIKTTISSGETHVLFQLTFHWQETILNQNARVLGNVVPELTATSQK